jgi:hypothetical protein
MYEFVESPAFERTIHGYLDDQSYGAMQAGLSQWSEAGDLIPGIRRMPEVALASAGQRQAWRTSCHLLRQVP